MGVEPPLLTLLDYAGVAVFALSGAPAAARNRMDPFGFVVIGVVTGVGGGSLRDLLLDAGPVFWVGDPAYLGVAAGAALLGWVLAPRLQSRMNTTLWSDAAGLALFSALGAQTAPAAGASRSVAVVMGMMSACFGGLVRDVICNELPLLLRREIYALAALAGAGVTVGALLWGAPAGWGLAAGAGTTFVIRAAAIRFDLSLPRYAGESRPTREGEDARRQHPTSRRKRSLSRDSSSGTKAARIALISLKSIVMVRLLNVITG